MSTAARVRAQAKVNLLLRVLARDSSGYHELETVFQRLELGDDVTVRTGGRSRSIDCDETELPVKGNLGPPEKNLAYRAAEAYRDATGWPSGWAIEVKKRIPVGGGLGGGSADAGAVLRILNALAPSPLSDERLGELGALLGSDVPFLTSNSATALGRGRGERLEYLPALPVRDVALGIFPFGVATRDAYAWLDASRTAGVPQASPLSASMFATWDGVAELASNDFEGVVGEAYPAITATLLAFRQVGARVALLSGSGATVFGIFDKRAPLVMAGNVRMVWTRTADSVVAVQRMG